MSVLHPSKAVCPAPSPELTDYPVLPARADLGASVGRMETISLPSSSETHSSLQNLSLSATETSENATLQSGEDEDPSQRHRELAVSLRLQLSDDMH